MYEIQLKDGTIKQYFKAVTGLEIAELLSPKLLKEAVAVRVNEDLWDLTRLVPARARVEIITRSSESGLEILRHDTAHVMAEAVKELYDNVLVAIGPAIEKGFYYDFYRDEPFTSDDLKAIEERMHEIVDRAEPFIREVWSHSQTIEFFKSKKETFKVEIIENIPSNEEISIYKQGQFIDPCRGPHLPTTKHLGHAFKLMSLAGAYWRGDSTKPMLQRIYGTAWDSEKQLKDYMLQLEEAEKRDHRRLGTELELFHTQEEAVGSVFWHPKGWTLYRTLEQFIRNRLEKTGYVEVKTPQLLDRSFWEASGHWEQFRENMFTVSADEDKILAIKPMNCPCHVQIFKQGIKSYRDLPLRMAEFGSCYRNEPSGSLHGLMRVRSFVQDDAHIFCTPSQIISEIRAFCELLHDTYQTFGFTNIRLKLSDRPQKRAGSDEIWDQAEKALVEAATAAGLEYTLNLGEGAFYGPKLEFVLRDALGRDWQCGTLQVDFILPERLKATYIAEDGQKHKPVMLHRAIFGSFERFIGILIEHYGGKFPIWLAPCQIVVVTITSEADTYAKNLVQILKEKGIRAQIDLRNEKIPYKIREHSLQKVPVILTVGKKEVEEKTVAIRRLGSYQQTFLPFEEFLSLFIEEIKLP